MFIFTIFSTTEWKLNFLVLRFKKVYIHVPCTMDGGGASFYNPGVMSTKEKSPCQTVNNEKKSVPDECLYKINSVPQKGIKKTP